jgi:hypothetical protein
VSLLRRSAGPRERDHGLELVSLLASGVPVTLPDDRQMKIGVLRTQSPCVDQLAGSGCLGGPPDDVEIMLVLRQDRVFYSYRDLKLEAGDRIVAVASPAAWGRLREHLDSVTLPPAQVAPGSP